MIFGQNFKLLDTLCMVLNYLKMMFYDVSDIFKTLKTFVMIFLLTLSSAHQDFVTAVTITKKIAKNFSLYRFA